MKNCFLSRVASHGFSVFVFYFDGYNLSQTFGWARRPTPTACPERSQDAGATLWLDALTVAPSAIQIPSASHS